jgi:hypothetical protein
MKIELQPRAGENAEQVLELKNFDSEKTRELELKLVELTQGDNGKLDVIEASEDLVPPEYSCLKWTNISCDSVIIPPLSTARVNVSVSAPKRTKGFYCAGLVVQSKPEKSSNGLALVVRFIVPVLVNIQGGPVRQKIELEDISLVLREQTDKVPSETLVSMKVTNKGKAFSRIKSNVKIMREIKGHWQNVTIADFKKSAVIPGLSLNYNRPIQRNLPTGKYRLKGTIYVDGRRIAPVTKEYFYTGDPTVTKVAYDTSLLIEPADITIEAIPGSTRSTVLKIENTSSEPINITTNTNTPLCLKGVSLGELKGDDLACNEWLRIIPEKFTLLAGAKRNIRIMAKLPKLEQMYPSYYSELLIDTKYNDGQSAGTTKKLVFLENNNSKALQNAKIMTYDIVEDNASVYAVRIRVSNVGNTHFIPNSSLVLSEPAGANVMKTALSGKLGPMLPMEIREYSGVVDFSGIEEGPYTLTIQIQCDNNYPIIQEVPVKISISENKRLVELIKG